MKLGLFDSKGDELYSSWQVGALRMAFAGVVLAPVAFRTLGRVSKKTLFWMFMVGLFGNAIPAYLFTMAELKIDSGYAGILNSLTPFFALIIGLTVFKLKVKSIQAVGMVLGMLGAVGLIAQNGFVGEFNLPYSMIVVIATFCYGLSVNFIHYKLQSQTPLSIAAVALLFAGLPSAVFLFTTDFLVVLDTNEEAWAGFWYIAILGVVGTALALALFNKLVLNTSVVISTSVTYLIPIVAVIWGFIFGESFTLMHAVFGAVILAGVYLVNRPKSRKALEDV
jgi:drug/metabolite transporter (DMT)-like permease